MPNPKIPKKPKCYVILVATGREPRYLAPTPDEEDGEPSTEPNTTLELSEALRFQLFPDARTALRDAVKEYPGRQFQLDAVEEP